MVPVVDLPAFFCFLFFVGNAAQVITGSVKVVFVPRNSRSSIFVTALSLGACVASFGESDASYYKLYTRYIHVLVCKR